MKRNIKKIKATFIGEDGSCGFKTGKQYFLTIGNRFLGEFDNIIIESEEKNRCEYESVISFLNN